MSYNKLGTSGMSGSDRRREASRIVDMIQDHLEAMTPPQRRFVEQMGDDFAPVSDSQLFWLRDILARFQ